MSRILPLINSGVTTEVSFFVIKNISNHIIKNNYCFTIFIWIKFFNTFLDIIRVFKKALESLKCFNLDILLHMGFYQINKFYQYLVAELLD